MPVGVSSTCSGFASLFLAFFPCASQSTSFASPNEHTFASLLCYTCSSRGQPAVEQVQDSQGQRRLTWQQAVHQMRGYYACSSGRTVKCSPSGDLQLCCCASSLQQHLRGALCSQGQLHLRPEVGAPLLVLDQPSGLPWPLPVLRHRLCFPEHDSASLHDPQTMP